MSIFLSDVIFPFLCLLSIMLGVEREQSAVWCKCFTRAQIPALSTRASQHKAQQGTAKGSLVVLHLFWGKEQVSALPALRAAQLHVPQQMV